jgi:hypothetical protein
MPGIGTGSGPKMGFGEEDREYSTLTPANEKDNTQSQIE